MELCLLCRVGVLEPYPPMSPGQAFGGPMKGRRGDDPRHRQVLFAVELIHVKTALDEIMV